MREFSFIDLEAKGALVDPSAADAEDEFEEELGRAAAGEWEALGLDSPKDLQPASIEEFRNGS